MITPSALKDGALRRSFASIAKSEGGVCSCGANIKSLAIGKDAEQRFPRLGALLKEFCFSLVPHDPPLEEKKYCVTFTCLVGGRECLLFVPLISSSQSYGIKHFKLDGCQRKALLSPKQSL